MGSGLAPLSQPVTDTTGDPVREYMRRMVAELASGSEPDPPADPQRGFIIGSERL